MADLTALANLMPHTEWCVAEHYEPGLACDDPFCQYARQDEAADLVANRDLLLEALAEAGVLREAEAEVERLRATVADAWDEGYDAGHAAARAVNPEWPEQPVNPHRAALEGDR